MKMKWIIRILIVAVLLAVVIIALNLAPNFEKDKYANETNLIINNNNVTAKLKQKVYVNDRGTIYISIEDTRKFF